MKAQGERWMIAAGGVVTTKLCSWRHISRRGATGLYLALLLITLPAEAAVRVTNAVVDAQAVPPVVTYSSFDGDSFGDAPGEVFQVVDGVATPLMIVSWTADTVVAELASSLPGDYVTAVRPVDDPSAFFTLTVPALAGDTDETNELNSGVSLSGTTLEVTDAGGTLSTDLVGLVDDADADPLNELNLGVSLSGTTLEVTDAGGTLTADLATLANPGSDSVGTAEVADGSLVAVDLGDEAGVDFASGDQTIDLTALTQTLRSVDLVAPTGGFAIVNASGHFWFVAGSGIGRCSIATGTGLDFTHLLVGSGASGGGRRIPAVRCHSSVFC